MNARRPTLATAALAVAALVLAAACSAPTARQADPDLRPTGAEAEVAVTVPGGPEALPTWQRKADGTAALIVPADLLFAKDSAALSPAAATVLTLILAEAVPAQHVLVEGHADSDGEASHNLALSERRAVAVADWLAAQGVPRGALAVVGWGEDRPALEEVDEAAKAKNRRVVVTVTPTPQPAAAAVRALAPRPRTIPGRLRTGRSSTRRSNDPPTTRRTQS